LWQCRTLPDCPFTNRFAVAYARAGSHTGAGAGAGSGSRTSARAGTRTTTPSSGGLVVTISPNPVPWSGNQIPNCSLANTWTYTQILDNFGSSELTLSDRTDYFDGALFGQKGNLGIVIPAGSKTTLTTRFCSAKLVRTPHAHGLQRHGREEQSHQLQRP
jgi:hypothetical protein